MNNKVEDVVKEKIADCLAVDKAEVTKEANLYEDLGADSLDVVEICMEIERHYQIAIPDENTENVRTVGELILAVEKAVIQ